MIAPREAFTRRQPRFLIGQVIRHARYGYRGVIVAFDEKCRASEQWYEQNQTQPERNQPWYHVLVDGVAYSTYAAETSLTEDDSGECIIHPWTELYFSGFDAGRYIRNLTPWPYSAP
ncbi:heat shock protein HspQ [Ruficoccus amylovorans]|uniref:Heat shock protein HspQ n=1 Tax=Ruficoccus amylovorans TaxID=1804625 RepID=A0A842HD99_9BACT|nr:heat shock protein HspQ [Ruficoccus amylovorans]MBC2593341.1 heat shock protein HspQ [Ruficoccus amylovorans]